MEKKYAAIIIIAIFVGIILFGGYTFLDSMKYFDNPEIKITNNFGKISNVTVGTNHNIADVLVGDIKKGETKIAILREPFGEATLKISYIYDGETKEWAGGYIESFGGYKVNVTFNSEGNIEWNYNFD